MDEQQTLAARRALGPAPDWLPERSHYPHLRLFGVLGGVASGKSTAARILEELGCTRIDADAEARQRLEEPGLRSHLIELFGPEVERPDGTVDRPHIARRAFADAQVRERLERLIHPEVRARMVAALDAAENAAQQAEAPREVVLDVPLLVESGWVHLCDHLIFLDTAATERDARAQRDRAWESGETARREATQVPLDLKRRLAERIFKNEDVARLRTELGAWLRDLRCA